MTKTLKAGDFSLDLTHPLVMGILNVTPDSFSDGGKFTSVDRALMHVREMMSHGVDIIDIGGESTRPGAAPVNVSEEQDRVLPVIDAIVSEFSVPVSIDTSKAEVMTAAVDAGAVMINDVRALTEQGALAAAALCDVPVCLMHMQGQPENMQNAPEYEDVITDVADYLRDRMKDALAAGIKAGQIIIDPGFGFGKSAQHNFTLLKHLSSLTELDCPLLVGLSRKSMIDAIINKPAEQRVSASIALALLAAERGANILRVHDVEATVDALAMLKALQQQ